MRVLSVFDRFSVHACVNFKWWGQSKNFNQSVMEIKNFLQEISTIQKIFNISSFNFSLQIDDFQ